MPKITIPTPAVAGIMAKLGTYVAREKSTRAAWFATNASIFANANDQGKADMLINLRNVHFWYLRFHPTEVQNAINQLIKDKPWVKAANGSFADFEELRSHIDNIIRGNQIQNMVIYDVALHIANFVNKTLLPNKYVYIHGKPHRHAKVIFPVINPMIRIKTKDYRIDRSLFPVMFNVLSTDEIEDFLCKFDIL